MRVCVCRRPGAAITHPNTTRLWLHVLNFLVQTRSCRPGGGSPCARNDFRAAVGSAPGLGLPGYTLRLPSCAWLPEGAAQTINLIWEEIDGGGTQVASVWSGEEIEHEIAGN